jgi:hypothetical protein
MKQESSKRVIAAIGVTHATIAAFTWRDIRSRSADQVRGSKRIWRIASGFNTIGAVAYWIIGRRHATNVD